jgi:integrase
MVKVPRLKRNRYGVYGLRMLWLDETGKRRETLHSLQTKDGATARVLALKFNLLIETHGMDNIKRFTNPLKITAADGEILDFDPSNPAEAAWAKTWRDDKAKELAALKAEAKAQGRELTMMEGMAGRLMPEYAMLPKLFIKSMRFSSATAAYLEEKKLDNKPQTIVEKGRTYKDFIDIFGDIEINLITKAEIVQWKTSDLKRGIKANRINKRLGQVNDFFNWAINHGHYTSHPTSPVENLFISNKNKLASKTEHYEPFNNDELKTIFSADYSTKMKKPDHYWCPLVALFSGARREEIAALLAADVKTVDGVPSFFIQEGKTADARRLVPLHPDLVKTGFLAYAQHVQALGHTYLFPHLKDGANGRGKNVGVQFSNWLDDCGIQDHHKVFHSFRHTVITRLHATGANAAHVKQISGHSSETQGVHFQTYTHDVGLQALSETLGRLSYPLNLEAVQLPDPTFSGFLKRWKLQDDREKARAKKFAKLPMP